MATLAEQLAPFAEGAGNNEASKDGRSADFEKGVVLKGPWETYADGFSEHVRRNARALALGGVPVALRSVLPKLRSPVGEELTIDRDYADLLTRTVGSVEAQIIQVVPTDGSLFAHVMHRYYSVQELAFINSRKVLYCVWERFAGLQSDDLAALKTVGQVWVGCNATAEFLKNEGVPEDKVFVFGCPYLPSDPIRAARGPKRKSDRPTFYHLGKWEPRKEQRNILGAFLCAFRPGEARLLIKTSEKAPFFDGYPPNIQISLSDWLADDRVKANGWSVTNVGKDVLAVTHRLSQDEVARLHHAGDCYVSLARGEGFDMPAFDAKLMGNLMLYTPSGGPQDFAHPEDVRVEPKGLVDAHPFYRWVPGSQYLDYEFEAAVEGYRKAAQKIRSGVSADQDLSSFSAEEIGAKMAAALRKLGDVGF